MARKKRPDPMNEGCITQIYHFIFPDISLKPVNMPLSDWHELVLNVKYRDIIRFSVKKAFKMPGLYWAAPMMRIQGYGYRQVKPGATLHVRIDSRFPDSVDVEWLGGQGEKDQIFTLDSSEWGWVKLHVVDAEPCV